MHRSRTAIAAGLGLTALAGLVYLGIAIADDPPAPPPDPGPIAKAVAAGKHVRIAGPRGPIHVWVPAGYRADTGATIIYVHGYFDDADTAWTGHQLPEQFALSALNALFVVPEAPVAIKVPINYPDVGELLRIVEERTGVLRGAALTAVVGHSGAFRTIYTWLDEPLIDQIVMIDAMYGDEPPLLAWFEASPRRRLISVGADTVLGTVSIAAKLPGTLVIDRFPPTWELWPTPARTARHVYIRSQFGHFPLVMDGVALPALLRLLPVELLVGDAAAPPVWKQPLGSIPALPDAATFPLLTDGSVD